MRTYLILKDKVARFNADAEIQGLLGELASRGAAAGARVKFSADGARELQGRARSTSRRCASRATPTSASIS